MSSSKHQFSGVDWGVYFLFVSESPRNRMGEEMEPMEPVG